MVENWNIILIFLMMGHIFPACSVSNEMVEIFVENMWFFERFAVRKTGAGPGLVGGSCLGRQAESCQLLPGAWGEGLC